MKIYFKNDIQWEEYYSLQSSVDQMMGMRDNLHKKNANGYYETDFDNNLFNHMFFGGGLGIRTDNIYPGKLSLCIEYKYNKNKEAYLTYLASSKGEKSGRIENYTLFDEENLFYRDDKSKKISVYIPRDYDGKTSYDILYFFDAQNLFCNSGEYTTNGDPYGSWQLDVVLDEIYRQYGKKILVVGIDNADSYRSQELFMDPDDFGKLSRIAKAIPSEDFSKGYLDNLAEFMQTTLHTFIKGKFNVNEDNIGIGGSSMGGIAAFYCGMRDLGFYRYILSYSPAFGLYEAKTFDSYLKFRWFSENQEKLPKIHIYCGKGDKLERLLLPASRGMRYLLVKNGYNDDLIFETYDDRKPHNEEAWRLVLPESFTFLLDL